MAESEMCELCRCRLAPAAHYVVRIDVFADPATPPLHSEGASSAALDESFAALMQQMKEMTVEELQDSVHRRIEFRLCAPCHRAYLANPLGKPRGQSVAAN